MNDSGYQCDPHLHYAMRRRDSEPAVTYPPTLCTSAIPNAKMLYGKTRLLGQRARSNVVQSGS